MGNMKVDVTAGLGGFLAFFLLAVALYLLMRNMTARLRRMAYREEQAKMAEGLQGGVASDDAGGDRLGPRPPDVAGPPGDPAAG